MPAMYDPTVLARYYASRAQSFSSLADENSSISRTIYLRLAEVFNGLAVSADRFSAELRGEVYQEQGSVQPQAPIVPAFSKPKRKRAPKKPSLTPTRFTDADVIDEVRH
jgi:hypothetical protein